MTRTQRNLFAFAVGFAIGGYAALSDATGVHAPPPIVLKPPVLVAPATIAPTAPPPPSVAVTPPPASVAAPEQPAAGGRGPGALGWWVMAGVAIYFGAVIREHWLWCIEDDRKPERERRCYRPLRDGMP